MGVIRFAIADGNWSDPATWNGGLGLPGPTDDVFTNEHFVNIDMSVSVNEITNRSNGTPSMFQGGWYIVTTAATITTTQGYRQVFQSQKPNGHALFHIAPSAGNVTFTSPFLEGSDRNGNKLIECDIGWTGALVINGRVEGGVQGKCAIYVKGSPSSIVINGDCRGNFYNSAGLGAGIQLDAPTTLTVNGNVSGGYGGFAYGVYCYSASNVAVTINGNVLGGNLTGGSFGPGVAFQNEGGGPAVVTGNVIGNLGVGIQLRNSSPLTVRGKIKSIGNLAISVTDQSYCPIRISGQLVAGGVEETGASVSPGMFPISGPVRVIEDETLDIFLVNDSAFPASMQGTPLQFGLGTGGAGTTNVVVPGNGTDVVARAAGALFTVDPMDANTVALTLPDTFDALADTGTITSQLAYVFGSSGTDELGWLTVIASGIVGLADTADFGGAPDYIPVVGTATFTPSIAKTLRISIPSQFIGLVPVTATFDSNGDLSYDGVKDLRILAPQWIELSNTSWKWQVDVRPGPGQSWPGFQGSFAGAPGSVFDLGSLL